MNKSKITTLVLLTLAATLTSAKDGLIPMPIPGTDSTYLAPNIWEIRLYFILLSAVGTILCIIGGIAVSRLFKKLDHIDDVLDANTRAIIRMDTELKHVPTKDKVREMIDGQKV